MLLLQLYADIARHIRVYSMSKQTGLDLRRNLMLRRGLFLSLTVSVFLVLASCASMAKFFVKTWDETLPESEVAMVNFWGSRVTGYNGVALEKKYTAIRIPAGNASFVIDMRFNWGTVTYRATGMEFDFSFEAGKMYAACSTFRGDDENDEVIGVEIYVWDTIPKVLSTKDMKRSSEHFVAFIPFKNQPTGWKRSWV
jgi:hypothetical protein